MATDNKIIAAAANYCVRQAVANDACAMQRGFIKGRRFLENIVELDTYARMFSLQSLPHTFPILALWDFSAAFPSVIHGWIFECLTACAFPIGSRNIVDTMYSNCFLFADPRG